MNWPVRSVVRLIVAVVLAAWHPVSSSAQAPIDVYDLADYRLTPNVFKQFVEAIADLGIFWAVLNEPPPGSLRSRRKHD